MIATFPSLYSFLTNADLGAFASIVGLVVSLVGLGVSFYVLRTVRDMRMKLFLNVRFPKLIKQLQDLASAVAIDMGDYPNRKNEIDIALEKCKSHLKSLATKLPGPTKAARTKLLRLLQEYRENNERKDEDHARAIYVSLNGVIQDLLNLSEDFKLE